jgi:hypothetical protein
MALLTINETVLESLARDKRSSLFDLLISDDEKKVYQHWQQEWSPPGANVTIFFSTSLVLRKNKLEGFKPESFLIV